MKINNEAVFLFSMNSRESLVKIGKKLNKSQQYINYNISKLEKNGQIKGYHTIFDYARFGYLVFHVYIKIIYSNQKQYDSMIADLMSNPHVIGISELGGMSDVLIEFAAYNPSAFNKAFKEVITKYSSQVQSYKVLIEILKHIYPKNYMSKKHDLDIVNRYRDLIVGADRLPLDLDEQQRRICYELYKDPKTPVVSIARAVGLSPKTVMLKIKELEKMRVIRGYRPLFDLEKLGVYHNKLFLELAYQNTGQEQELINFLKEFDYVTGVTKTIGHWDLILDIETFSSERFRKVFLTIREKVKGFFRDVECSSVDCVYSRSFLPMSYFEDLEPRVPEERGVLS